ncbi:MAG: hypothetical protein ABR511_08290 [Acidimicrobiales bacterium]
MTALWIALAVLAITGALVVLKVLSGVLGAARQLQRNVETLGQSVRAELERLDAEAAAGGATGAEAVGESAAADPGAAAGDSGDAIDETHPR